LKLACGVLLHKDAKFKQGMKWRAAWPWNACLQMNAEETLRWVDTVCEMFSAVMRGRLMPL
jgi:hypothetical protein